jgi:hypothetical protein
MIQNKPIIYIQMRQAGELLLYSTAFPTLTVTVTVTVPVIVHATAPTLTDTYTHAHSHTNIIPALAPGADTINDNLRYMANLSAPSTTDNFERERGIEAKHGAKTQTNLHTLLLKRSKPSDYTRLIKEARFFTFVTDPIERFLFAVNECYLRNVIPHSLEWKNHQQEMQPQSGHTNAYNKKQHKIMKTRKYQEYVQNHQVSSDTAKLILNAILTGDTEVIRSYLLTIPSVNHFYPMSNMLKEFQPDFVGDSSRLLEQWPRVEELYGLTLPLRFPPDHKKYLHMGKVDTLGLVRAMRGLLSQQPGYMQALCKLYRRDYVCFDIPLPLACGGR